MASPDDVYFAELGSVRKQIYITTEHDRKLKRLAQRWNCTEAAIVRRALDDVRDDDLSPEDAFFEQLRAQGSIVDYSNDPDLPSEDEVRAIRARLAMWVGAHPGSIGLDEALREDRDTPH